MKPEENERLVRVGPGTPAGEMLRRYWQPALLSEEIPEPDCPPVRVRLMCEDLLAFRDTNGRIGLVEAYCPHRRAPFFFGRNEECGIRCAYHGWKFDVDGNCMDMPSEPTDIARTLIEKVKLTAYPTIEKGGVIWAYMGPPDKMPPPPDYEWTRAPQKHRFVSKTFEGCNYLQAMEGGFDTAHSSFAHNIHMNAKYEPRNADKAPRLDIEHTDYGYCYISTRQTGPDTRYIRVYHCVLPNQQFRGGIHSFEGERRKMAEVNGHIWVPIDDETTWVYNWMLGYDESVVITPEHADMRETFYGRGKSDLIPGTYKLKKNLSNDYMIDRSLQKTSVYTGIVGINTQDFALQEGMGPIVDRSKEFLGSSDRAIIQLRRLLFEAIDDAENGKPPRGVHPESYRDVRPYDDMIRGDAHWKDAFAKDLKAKW